MRAALVALLVAVTTTASAEIRSQRIEYRQGDTVLEGVLVLDTALKGKNPGVLIVHDWMGVGDYVLQRAEQLARLGYVAFVADIYGKGVRAKNSQEASRLASLYRADRALLRARAAAGVDQLKGWTEVDPARIAAIGYCFGGGTVLELARSGADVAGVVSFHGNLDTPNPADAKDIKARVLVLHGADDPYVPPAQVQGFEQEMRGGGVDWQLISFGGAVHAFSQPGAGDDPSTGAAYHAPSDKRSFAYMQEFFREVLGR